MMESTRHYLDYQDTKNNLLNRLFRILHQYCSSSIHLEQNQRPSSHLHLQSHLRIQLLFHHLLERRQCTNLRRCLLMNQFQNGI